MKNEPWNGKHWLQIEKEIKSPSLQYFLDNTTWGKGYAEGMKIALGTLKESLLHDYEELEKLDNE
jgi:hypothetical protein